MLRSLDSGVWVSLPEQFEPCPEDTVCITGHRFKSIIPYKNDPENQEITESCVKLMLLQYIDFALKAGFSCFMDGLASGTDLTAAQYIINKKRSGADARLVGAMPFLKHSAFFSRADRQHLREIELNCDTLICTCPDPDVKYSRTGPEKDLYKTRNYFMADCSSAALAFYDSSAAHSGTGQTVRYLRSQGKPIAAFSCGDVHRLLDSAGGDIKSFAIQLKQLSNPFTSV